MIDASKNSPRNPKSLETLPGFSLVDTAEQSAVEGGITAGIAGVIIGAAIGVAVLYVAYKVYEGYNDGQKAGGCGTPVT